MDAPAEKSDSLQTSVASEHGAVADHCGALPAHGPAFTDDVQRHMGQAAAHAARAQAAADHFGTAQQAAAVTPAFLRLEFSGQHIAAIEQCIDEAAVVGAQPLAESRRFCGSTWRCRSTKRCKAGSCEP